MQDTHIAVSTKHTQMNTWGSTLCVSLSTHANDAKAATVMLRPRWGCWRMWRQRHREIWRLPPEAFLRGDATSLGHRDSPLRCWSKAGRRGMSWKWHRWLLVSHPNGAVPPYLLCSRAAPSTPRTQCALKYHRDVVWTANLITQTYRERRGSIVANVIKKRNLAIYNKLVKRHGRVHI